MANRKNTNSAFSRNQTIPGTQVKGANPSGGNHPPMNRIAVSEHISAIETYSPSMNIMYGVEPYSTMKPATSSDSASVRSNGGRLVSARAEMKNTTNIGSSGSQYQFRNVSHGSPMAVARPVSWARTMSDRLSEPAHRRTVTTTKPIETS